MTRVRVVTDSTASLDPEIVKDLGITIMPMQIHVGGEIWEETPDFDKEAFFRRMAHLSEPPRSEPLPVEAFVKTYEALGRSTDHILSLHGSSKLSDTCRVAREAAKPFWGCYEIAVMDSETTSVGLGILVKAAAEAAMEGQSLDDITRLIRGMIPRIYVVFFVEKLDYLERKGRLRPAQAVLGTMLNIKPFITMQDGELIPMEKVRTREKAVDKVFEFISEFSEIEQIAILQSTLYPTEDTKALLERLDGIFPDLEVPIEVYGPTLASQLGLEALGVIVFEAETGFL